MEDDFNRHFARFSNRLEKGLILLICLCVFLLIAGELLLTIEPARSVLVETERLEGVSHKP
ncbi:hypothetical protein NDK47_15275 [Brevibacillus ruminantium]|uniref:Uncharacterized protein n=1 Tax=Brevibacillus ruminantium TaxID=2950604 RepID=A0ABY4W8N8_9BACL|nr:hypothetical protein [Brevibacillus ruminantium]USG63537.1 hypothetical protein NDK47_15275 [Brevibacillus ruminantium]